MEEEAVLASEFSEVLVSKVHTGNGARLLIRDAKSEREILLCPLELESLTWQTADTFSDLLSTPLGPEVDGA